MEPFLTSLNLVRESLVHELGIKGDRHLCDYENKILKPVSKLIKKTSPLP